MQQKLKVERKHQVQLNNFIKAANKYLSLQNKDGFTAFIAVIAKSPNDLKLEGQALNHCVGRMDYDKRVVNEGSLIFFVRNVATIDTPLVTVEYLIKNKKGIAMLLRKRP